VGQPEAYQGSWVERLNQAGYSVTGIDLPGHGRSDGLHGYVNSFQEDLIDTVVQAAR
jgi:alpha-beta hydrolase superfamily lysophospholipase